MKKKKVIFSFVLFILILFAIFLYIPKDVDAGPGLTCKPIGCKGGTQLCADITVGPITYHCYEKKPVK